MRRLICAFVFAYVTNRFSHDVAQMSLLFSCALVKLTCTLVFFIKQEYGIKVEEKLHISQSICTPLLRKIHSDLLQVCQQNVDEESTRLNSKYVFRVFIPPANCVCWGVYCFHFVRLSISLSVHPSVHPFVRPQHFCFSIS